MRIGRDGFGQAMQVQTIFSQRFSMIADIKQRGLELRVVFPEQLDYFCQKMIGIENCIVIGIADFLAGAAAEIAVFARGFEFFELGRIAAKIGRAVVAHLMQHDEDVSLGV